MYPGISSLECFTSGDHWASCVAEWLHGYRRILKNIDGHGCEYLITEALSISGWKPSPQ
ncbi:hypothetical protein M758_3G007900 [Ceratodon purpureus]|uniref:Uncharacterized protein n=1 Tax=Ceratodon purpureus TaxID=3225 RepID=A0A8T0IG41_CERPU|nr:hypothetical protein KC19_3G010200 [Ceratodon purpureus]KAG0621285.1 hypothetical protein M758_3G007900 [Ceratodon purpureus]